MGRLMRKVARLGSAGIALGVLALAVSAAAQTPPLAEVARKEAERRKATKAAGKVYTNKDLPESARTPAPPAGSSTTIPLDPVEAATTEKPAEGKPGEVKGGEVKAGEAEPAPKDVVVKNEAYWKARMAAARDELRRNELFAESLQTRINSLSRDFVNRDNPAQRTQIGRDRTDALSELNRVKGDIETGKKAIADMEEEARKSGVPAGWLR